MIDTHCHLSYPDFDPDRDATLQRARDAGITGFVTIGTGPEDWERCLEIARSHRGVRVALGIHPNEAGRYDTATFARLRKLAEDELVVGVGETGLDFFRDNAPREAQFVSFHAHLELAAEIGKPFILHCRAAEKEMLDVLHVFAQRHSLPLNGVWHCFTASEQFGLRAAALGLYFGIGGIVTYPKAEEMRTALAALPAERIVLETDAPFLPPQPWRGKRNESSYLTAVVEKTAAVRGTSVDAIKRETTANALRLFGAGGWDAASGEKLA